MAVAGRRVESSEAGLPDRGESEDGKTSLPHVEIGTVGRYPHAATLTFLAPADRCNQRCADCYITEVVGEPVETFALEPADYATFVRQFVQARVPIASVTFQGYEVTLPRSWPYLEAAFEVAREFDLCRSFITNGMLLHKWTDRIREIDPTRLTVSLDGASARVNDRHRGLDGAFDATVHSLRQLVEAVPSLVPRIAVASTLYDEDNASSLLKMPRFLSELGISRWVLTPHLRMEGDRARTVRPAAWTARWFRQFEEVATSHAIRCHINDEFGFFDQELRQLSTAEPWPKLNIKRIFDPRFLLRIDPLGHIRSGASILEPWSPDSPRWDPKTDNAVDVAGYWRLIEQTRSDATKTITG